MYIFFGFTYLKSQQCLDQKWIPIHRKLNTFDGKQEMICPFHVTKMCFRFCYIHQGSSLIFILNFDHKVYIENKMQPESPWCCRPPCWWMSRERTVICGPMSSHFSTGKLKTPMTLWLPEKNGNFALRAAAQMKNTCSRLRSRLEVVIAAEGCFFE